MPTAQACLPTRLIDMRIPGYTDTQIHMAETTGTEVYFFLGSIIPTPLIECFSKKLQREERKMFWHICVFKKYSHPECLRRYGARQMMEGLR